MDLKQTVLKSMVVAMALAIAGAFVWHRMRIAETRQRITSSSAYGGAGAVTDTVPRNDHPGLMATMARLGVVIDIYGTGGLITLDSLKRRIAAKRMLMVSSKSIVTIEGSDREQTYLDSLLSYAQMPLDPHAVLGRTVADSFGTGRPVTIDSLMNRTAAQGWLLYNGEWYIPSDSFSPEWDYLTRQIERAATEP